MFVQLLLDNWYSMLLHIIFFISSRQLNPIYQSLSESLIFCMPYYPWSKALSPLLLSSNMEWISKMSIILRTIFSVPLLLPVLFLGIYQ